MTIQLLGVARFSCWDQVLALILVPSTANELGLGFEIKVMDRYDRRGYGRLAFSIFKTVFAPSFG